MTTTQPTTKGETMKTIKKNQSVVCKGRNAYISQITKHHVSMVVEGGTTLTHGELASYPVRFFWEQVNMGRIILK